MVYGYSLFGKNGWWPLCIVHMGPVKQSERENLGVVPYRYIGLSTFAFLLEGSIIHRDILGYEKKIKQFLKNGVDIP